MRPCYSLDSYVEPGRYIGPFEADPHFWRNGSQRYYDVYLCNDERFYFLVRGYDLEIGYQGLRRKAGNKGPLLREDLWDKVSLLIDAHDDPSVSPNWRKAAS